ncbi:MAG: hypothetical protein ACRENX_01225 [Candidatus Dormibacteria bacterium]
MAEGAGGRVRRQESASSVGSATREALIAMPSLVNGGSARGPGGLAPDRCWRRRRADPRRRGLAERPSHRAARPVDGAAVAAGPMGRELGAEIGSGEGMGHVLADPAPAASGPGWPCPD